DAAAQPMTSEDGRFTLAYNGEIYNYPEVRATLESLGRRVTSSGDTEVILRAFQEWGTGAFTRLRGMFALAIWDAAEGTMFLSRDRLGIKPLYVRRLPEGLAFASEIRALLATNLACPRLSPAGLRSYLGSGAVAEPY